MRTVRLRIAYDGTDFHGWQRQALPSKSGDAAAAKPGSAGSRRSVQECIEYALARIHRHPVAVTGAGRTDAGVHAVGQVACFRTDIKSMDPGRFVPALNGFLPRDIRVLEAAETIPDFHARFDASSRTYRYHFICGRHALPHENRYALQMWRRPRMDLLNSYCRLLLGEIDCSVFAATGDSSKSSSRHITRAVFLPEGNGLVFEIRANAFLWKMVRSVAGTLLHYEEKSAAPELMRDVIASRDRGLAGPTLPPHGLFLWKVDYYRGNGNPG